VIQDEETGQVSGITPTAVESGQASEVTFAATEVDGDATLVMEIALVTCQMMECKLGSTSTEHPQYYHPKVLTQPSFLSPLPLPIKSYWYHLGQSQPSQER
jgi:hypothetical protein